MDRFFNTTYLFDINPQGFQYQNIASVIIFIFIGLSFFALWILKKRRGFVKINKEQRYVLKSFVKVDMVLGGLAAIFLGFRIMDIDSLSMRIWLVVIALAALIINLIAIIKAYLLKETQEIKAETPDQYAKYLPHKKKK